MHPEVCSTEGCICANLMEAQGLCIILCTPYTNCTVVFGGIASMHVQIYVLVRIFCGNVCGIYEPTGDFDLLMYYCAMQCSIPRDVWCSICVDILCNMKSLLTR